MLLLGLFGCGGGGVKADAVDGLVLNELLAKNLSTNTDEMGENDDWVELLNGGDKAVSLDGLALSDDPASPSRWLLTGDALAPGDFLLLWCDGQPEQGDAHAPFKLSGKGEHLQLSFVEGDDTTLIDEVEYAAQADDISWARVPDGDLAWVSATPTPGESNGS
jgi:hypothetical protein